MVISVWIETIVFVFGAAMWLIGIIAKSTSAAAGPLPGAAPSANLQSPTGLRSIQLGLRILEAIYCVKGSVSLARVVFMAIVMNLCLYNLLHFAGLGMVVVQQMIKAGAPPGLVPTSMLETLAKVWRTIDITDTSVVLSILLFFVSAVAADLACIYGTIASYRYAVRKGSVWPVLLTIAILGIFLYFLPYLYFDQKNKPFLAYLLSHDYGRFALFGLPGSQIFFIQDSFAYREIIFPDQRAFQLLGLLAPISATLPISVLLLAFPIVFGRVPALFIAAFRSIISRFSPEFLSALGGALVVISGVAVAITAAIAAIAALSPK